MAKKDLHPYEQGPVRLRLLSEADLPMTLSWRNQDEIRRWFFHPDPISPDQHHNWFENYRQRDDDFVFIIEAVEFGYQPVGQVAIYHIDRQASRAEYGRLMIGESEARGKGLAKAATQAVLQIAFGQLGLEKVYLEVYSDNTGAISLYKSVGFAVENVCDNVIKMSISQ